MPPARRATADQHGTVERLLASYGVPPASAGNRVELVTTGVDAYTRVIELIEEARSTIHITTYILGSDEGSQALVDCLTRRAARGRGGPLACSTTSARGGSGGGSWPL